MSVWEGSPPTVCDICDTPIGDTFIDGRTRMGPWGMLCPGCHRTVGTGLGIGKGQKYKLVGGVWTQVEGGSGSPPPPPAPPAPPAQPDDGWTLDRVLTSKTSAALEFKRMLADLDPVIDGPRLQREFGMTSEQIAKYCKKRRPEPPEEPEYVEGLDF